MSYIDELRQKALKAKEKRALLGSDVDLSRFESAPVKGPEEERGGIETLSEEERKKLIMTGIDPDEKARGGTYFQKDTSVIHCGVRQEGVEILSLKEALKEDWIYDYYWKLVPIDTDKYTAAAELELHDGYVIRALPGKRCMFPVQACLYISKDGLQQNVHNIIIAEEGSELHIITGCSTSPHARRGLHVGVSEFFIKKGAKLTFTMIHNWADDMYTRPRSVAVVEEGGLFLSNYVSLKPVKSIQMYPTTHLQGEDAVARFYSIIVGTPGSEYDMGSRIYLKVKGCRAEIVSRVISNGANIIARGHLIGEVEGVKGHLECRGLLLNGGIIHAIPELEGHADGVELSHEAAVGKIAQEEITYLMSRGLSEDEAISTIVRGFLSVDMPGIPEPLKAEIDRAIEESDKDVM